MAVTNLALMISAVSLAVTLGDETFPLPTGINPFTNNLLKALPDNDKNLICSPFSLHAGLSLIYQGVDNETAEAFEVLYLPEPLVNAQEYKNLFTALNTTSQVLLLAANKIYIQNGYRLNENYTNMVREYYSADVEVIDFLDSVNATDEINAWAEQKTNNKIRNLISPESLDNDTRAILVNAIYFKGNWLFKFDQTETFNGIFHQSKTATVTCQFMNKFEKYGYRYLANLKAQALRLKYADQRFSMIIVLPKYITGLLKLQRELAERNLASFAPKSLRSVRVRIPKFTFESTLNLNQPLKKLGLGKIFSDVDFSNMVDTDESLYVSNVIQKGFLEVNEEGTDAAAISVTNMMHKAASHATFIADHPFVFYITATLGDPGSSETILFTGRVVTPVEPATRSEI